MIKNFKFDRFSKSDYTNAFQIDIEIFDLILKTSKLEHQNLWFKNFLATATAFSIFTNAYIIINIIDEKTRQFDKILFNEIIVHAFFDHAVEMFINFVNKYSKI